MRWTNPGVGRKKRTVLDAPPTFTAIPSYSVNKNSTDGADGDVEKRKEDSEDGPDNQDKDDDEEGIRNSQTPQAQTPAPEIPAPEEERPALSQVQILDLHTSNPIVSYEGVVYSCQWARNIGTELLFTPHDPSSNLPVLRNLPGDVDLLAASSARLVSNVLELKPKAAPLVAKRSEKLPRKRKNSNTEILIGPHSREKRKSQAQFLEKLINIKAKRGEEDLVTVTTTKRMTANKIKADFKTMRENEKRKLRNLIKRERDLGVIENARQRLEYIEKDEEAQRTFEEKAEKNLLPWRPGRKRKIVRIAEDGVEIRPGGGEGGEGEKGIGPAGVGSLSTGPAIRRGRGRPKKVRVAEVGSGEMEDIGGSLEGYGMGGDGAEDARSPEYYDAASPKSYDEEMGEEDMQDLEGGQNGYGYGNDGQDSGEEQFYDAAAYGEDDP